MLVIVTGVPGSGKTTVAGKAVEELKSEGVDYEIITYGTVMFDIAKAKKLVEDRDEMRKLPLEDQKRIQKTAAEAIHKKSQRGNVLLDTHCTIKTSRGFLPGLPEEVLKILDADCIVIVEVKGEDILKRREGDKSRDRDDDGVKELMFHQDFNRIVAGAYSVISGASIKVVENPQGQIGKAVKEMKGILGSG
ncbi:MAG: adenylate kinase [Candidatus Altiarchaeota archaeon]